MRDLPYWLAIGVVFALMGVVILVLPEQPWFKRFCQAIEDWIVYWWPAVGWPLALLAIWLFLL